MFWRRDDIRDALKAQHFGRFLAAYRAAHNPKLTQATLGRWLGISQVHAGRLERAKVPPADLRKLQRWTEILHVPADLLWFTPSRVPDRPHRSRESMSAREGVSLDDVRRRDMLKVTGAVAAGAGILANAPWERLSEAMAGRRAADNTTVTMIENRTAEFFRSEETMPARQLVTQLRVHFKGLRDVIERTSDSGLRQRLLTCLGQTEALTGWALFDMQRNQDAVRLYQNALASAKEAGDTALATCVMGYWSYLIGGKGETEDAVRMLTDASEQIRGGAPVTQAWISARRAEEHAVLGDQSNALRALDHAVNAYDYASSGGEQPWTCFFTPTRFGSLTVSTYGRLDHPETDRAADTLLRSMAPTENKVKSLVLADLATSAARARDYDRVQSLSQRSAKLALKTECSLAIDRLWDLAEVLPATALKEELVDRLMAKAGRNQARVSSTSHFR